MQFSIDPNKTFNIQRGCRKGIYEKSSKKDNETDFCMNYMKNHSNSGNTNNVTCDNCFDFFCNSAENQNMVRFWMFLIAIFVVVYMNQRA